MGVAAVLLQLALEQVLDVGPVGRLDPAALHEQIGEGFLLAAWSRAGTPRRTAVASIRSACRASTPKSRLRSVSMKVA